MERALTQNANFDVLVDYAAADAGDEEKKSKLQRKLVSVRLRASVRLVSTSRFGVGCATVRFLMCARVCDSVAPSRELVGLCVCLLLRGTRCRLCERESVREGAPFASSPVASGTVPRRRFSTPRNARAAR